MTGHLNPKLSGIVLFVNASFVVFLGQGMFYPVAVLLCSKSVISFWIN